MCQDSHACSQRRHGMYIGERWEIRLAIRGLPEISIQSIYVPTGWWMTVSGATAKREVQELRCWVLVCGAANGRDSSELSKGVPGSQTRCSQRLERSEM